MPRVAIGIQETPGESRDRDCRPPVQQFNRKDSAFESPHSRDLFSVFPKRTFHEYP